MLHKKDLSRIRFQRVAKSTGQEVPAEEIVKGYEIEKNRMYPGGRGAPRSRSARSTGIEIQELVQTSRKISSLYFEKPYYLEPDKGAGKAFLALLREALKGTKTK